MGNKDDMREEVKETLKTLSCLQDNTTDYMFVMDLTQEKAYFVNDISERFPLESRENHDYSIVEWQETIYKPDREVVMQAARMLESDTGSLGNVEFRLMDKTGDPVWVNCSGNMRTESILVGSMSETALKRQIDPMTGLRNSNQLYMDLDRDVKDGQPGYLVLFDMDDFQNINTSYGRAYGNQILQWAGCLLEECMGRDSRIYRLDGDRFAAKIAGSTPEAIEEKYQELQEKLSPNYSMSAGALQYPYEQVKDSNTLFQYAETSVDQAKREGKNRLMFFSVQWYEKHLYKVELTEEMRRSTKNDFQGFELYFQPQISKDGYKVNGAEALLRYQSYYQGMASPVLFIPLLEQSGLIVPVGKWVIRESFRQCRNWRKVEPDFVMSINLSYIQLRDNTLIDFITEELAKAQIPGSAIILELTESEQLQEFAEFNKIFYALGKMGIRIAIDDFGTGYSSLAYLKSLEVDEVKIDRCFVSKIQYGDYNYRLIRNVIELARSLDIQVCCEGVENEAELEVLEQMRPEKMQGFLFGKPVPAETFEQDYLNKSKKNQEEMRRRYSLYLDMRSRDGKAVSVNGNGQELLKILDAMEELIYVADMSTHEVYYMNQTCKRTTGCYEYKGRKCYEAMYGKSEPCEFCTNHLLEKQGFFEWNVDNKYLKSKLLMRDKMISWKGKNARLGMGMRSEIIEQYAHRDEDKKFLESGMIKALVKYRETNDLKQAIHGILDYLGDFYKAEQGMLFLHNETDDIWQSMDKWQDIRINSAPCREAEFDSERIARLLLHLHNGKMYVLDNVDNIREIAPEEWELMKRKEIFGLMVCPLIYEGKLLGFFELDNPKSLTSERYLLQGIADYLAEDFSRRGYFQPAQTEEAGKIKDLMQQNEILDLTQLGLWVIQIDTASGASSMHADSRMLQLLQVDGDKSGREIFNHWYERINDGYYKYIQTALERMMRGDEVISVEYTWNHPTLGEVPVRCVGKLSVEKDGVYTLKGYHRLLCDMRKMQFLSYNNEPETFEYNEKKHTIYFHTNRDLIYGRSRKEDGFPYTWIRRGIIHPYFIDRFQQMFTNVDKQDDSQYEDMLLLNKDKEFAWYRVETRKIGETELDKHTLIVILHPIMEERDIPLRNVWKDDFYQAMLSETIAYLEVDLENGMIQNGGGLWEDYVQEGLEKKLTYSEIFQNHIADVIREKDYESYSNYLNLDNIKRKYFEGQRTTQHAFRRKTEDGGLLWVQLMIHVFQEKITGNMYALLYLKDIEVQKQRQIAQEREASRDPLTEVLNRRSFQRKVEEYMLDEEKSMEVHAFLMMDLDDFKNVNDTCGHLVGDQMLQKFAEILKETFRKTDVIGRLGGDEFVVFVKNIKSRKILDTRLEEFMKRLQEEDNHLGSSIGVRMLENEDFDYDTVFRQADEAMYISKGSGKNSYTYYDDIRK